MTTLVTGASGRVGRRLVERLQVEGRAVRALVLPNDPGERWLSDRDVEVVAGDVGDSGALRRATRGVEHVVHLAAVMDWTPAAARTTFGPNVAGTVNLLQSLVEQDVPPARVVIASSDEVYPSLAAAQLPIREGDPSRPWSFYGLTKLLSEETGAFFHRAHGLPVTVARFALIAEADEILTPSGWSGRFMFATSMREMLAGMGRTDAVAALDASGSIGDDLLLAPHDANGESYLFHICDVRDLVEGLMLMLEAPAAVGETFNLSGPAPFSFEHAVTRLHERAGLPYRTVQLPGAPIRVAHSIEKAADLLGYRPTCDIDRIIDDAVARRDGAAAIR